MKSENLSVMDAIYRNADMGVSSTKSIIKKVCDAKLKSTLQEQIDYYSKSLSEIEIDYAKKDGEPDKLNPMIKAWAKVDLQMQTMQCDSSKIAELMIEGTNMGIIEIEKSLNCNKNIPDKIKEHAESVIRHEKKYIEDLKPYL